MYYRRVNIIEQRIKATLSLIMKGRYDTKALAKEMKVSRPTVIRTVGELRRRGNAIAVVRDDWGWYYKYEGKYLMPVRRTNPDISAKDSTSNPT